MSSFTGFQDSDDGSVAIPALFFTELLPQIDDLGEMRIMLYAFWNLGEQSKEPRFLCLSELTRDSRLMGSFGAAKAEQEENLSKALMHAIGRGTLLDAISGNETYYFLNSPRGKAAREGLISGKWNPNQGDRISIRLQPARPNIYALYEQNIGPLTPIIADTLQDAENNYPAEWIDEAIRIAVTKNVRNWRYVDAILKGWKEKGRNGTDWKSTKEDRKRDSEGKFGDYIKH